MVICPWPSKDPSIPSPFNCVTSQTRFRQESPAAALLNVSDSIFPLPSGIWSTSRSVASATQVPSPFNMPGEVGSESTRWANSPVRVPRVTYRRMIFDNSICWRCPLTVNGPAKEKAAAVSDPLTKFVRAACSFSWTTMSRPSAPVIAWKTPSLACRIAISTGSKFDFESCTFRHSRLSGSPTVQSPTWMSRPVARLTSATIRFWSTV